MMKLSRTRRTILEMLVNRQAVSKDSLKAVLWAHLPNEHPTDPDGTIRVHIHYLRQYLSPHNVPVKCERGTGQWRIPVEAKPRAREALAQGLTDLATAA